MEKTTEEKIIRSLFIARIVLWLIAAGATAYWIYWSFYLYQVGIFDIYDYGKYFRPIFGRGLLITAVCIGISFGLRTISDKIKKKNKSY